ncbi:MAG: helix-turn-helix domain-containing protein [Christensenellales bacterium]|jgi:AraC-like DNA-binding protein
MIDFVLQSIVLAHHFIAPPGWVSDEYTITRLHHGIIYVLSGQAEYHMKSGNNLILKTGDVLYVPTGTAYVTQCLGEDSFVHMTVNFDLVKDGRLFPTPTKCHFHTSTRIEQVLSTLIRHWTVRHPFYRERCLGLLYEIIYLLLRETSSTSKQLLKKLQPAQSYLDEHFCENFPLELLPNLCGLSATYFRRLFRNVFHETPGEYRTRLRIAKASDMLLSGLYSVEHAGYLCGFSDPAYFSRMFRKTMGQSPTQFLKSYKEKIPEDNLIRSPR